MSRKSPMADRAAALPAPAPSPVQRRRRSTGADGLHSSLMRAQAILASAHTRMARWGLDCAALGSAESSLETTVDELEALPAGWAPPRKTATVELRPGTDVLFRGAKRRIVEVNGNVAMVVELDESGDPDLASVALATKKELRPCR